MGNSVSDLITAAQDFETSALNKISTFGDTLKSMSTDISYSYTDWNVDFTVLNLSDDNYNALIKSVPDKFTAAQYTTETTSYKPQTIGSVDVTVNNFTGSEQEIDLPTRPSMKLTETLPTSPTVTYPDDVAAPTYTDPTKVNLTALTAPDQPNIEMPSYINTIPTNDLTAPTSVFSFAEVGFQSDIRDELQSKVLSDLKNGGYGIESTDETALRDRAVDMETDIWQTEKDSLKQTHAALGLALPSGALAAALTEANNKKSNKLSAMNRETMVNRADLFRQNRQYMISKGHEITQMEMNYHGAVMERSLNASKYLVEAAVSIFNAEVANFNSKLDLYKANVEVFKARCEANKIIADIYGTEVNAYGVKVSAQKTQVDNYAAQWGAIKIMEEVFATKVEANKVKAEITGIKIQAFKAQVEAYTAYVQSKVAEFNMYEAAVKGELAKVEIYKADVEAYATVTRAKEIAANIEMKNIDIKIKGNEQLLEKYKADLQYIEQKLRLNIAQEEADVKQYEANLDRWKAQGSVLEAMYRTDIAGQQVNIEALRSRAQGLLQQAEISIKKASLIQDAKLRAATAGMDGYARAAASALSGMNTLVADIQQQQSASTA